MRVATDAVATTTLSGSGGRRKGLSLSGPFRQTRAGASGL
jgi:hypothetical protein